MAETFANLTGLKELAQQLQSKCSIHSYATNDNSVYFYQLEHETEIVDVKPSDYSASEQAIYSLERAKAMAGRSPSIKKAGIDAEIETIISNFRGANKAIADVGGLLAQLVKLYEETEKKLRSKLDHTEYEYDSTGHRVYHFTVDKTKEQTPKPAYVPHPVGEDLEWSDFSFRNPFVAENGQYGLNLCLFEFEGGRWTPSGTRNLSEQFICLTAKAGIGRQTSDGDRALGVDIGFNLSSVSGGKTNHDDSFSLGYGYSDGIDSVPLPQRNILKPKKVIPIPSFTFMAVEHSNGTMDTTIGVPETPVSITIHEKGSFKDIGHFFSSTPWTAFGPR